METEARSLREQVTETLKRVRLDPRVNNKPVLGVNVIMLQAAKNGGYPKHMYHESEEPIVVMNDDEEQAVSRLGYVPNYIKRLFPKWKFRRNMDEKFKADGFVEHKEVRTIEAESALVKQKPAHGCGPWVDKVSQIESLPEAPTEDPAVTIARLQGQLEAVKQDRAAKG